MPNSISRSVYEHAVATNQEILRNAEAIDSEWPTVSEDAYELPESIQYDVVAFRAALKKHFDTQEQTGYLAEPISLAPHLQGRADALRREHSDLLLETDKLLETLEAASAEELVGQRELFRQLIWKIRQHEQAENALVLEAFNGELGSAD